MREIVDNTNRHATTVAKDQLAEVIKTTYDPAILAVLTRELRDLIECTKRPRSKAKAARKPATTPETTPGATGENLLGM